MLQHNVSMKPVFSICVFCCCFVFALLNLKCLCKTKWKYLFRKSRGVWELVRTVSIEDAHFCISHSKELDVLGFHDIFKSGNEEGQDWSLIPTKCTLISTGDPREMWRIQIEWNQNSKISWKLRKWQLEFLTALPTMCQPLC